MGAMNLDEDQGARAFLTAVRESTTSVADRKRLSTIMLNLASDAARRRLETMMTTMEWKSDFIEGFVRQDMEQGIEQGIEQGAAQAKSEDVLKIIDARAIDATARAARAGLIVHRHRSARRVVRQRPHSRHRRRHLQDLTAPLLMFGPADWQN